MLLLRIIRKEVVHNVLSFRFAVTYVLLFTIVVVSMFLMGAQHETRMDGYLEAEGELAKQLDEIMSTPDEGQKVQKVMQADFSGVRAPQPLAVLARGLEGSLPTQVSSRSRWIMRSSDDRLGRNVLYDVFQAPDFVYVVNIVLSLLALLFVFDSICGEKERGTLKILMSNSVPRDTVLLGKWVGGYLSICVPFAVATLGGFVYLSLSGGMQLREDDVIRFVFIAAISLLYIAVFFSLGLFISTATHRGSTALLMSLLVWIGWILVVPNLAPITARLMAPVPSRQVIDAEQQAIDREAQLLQAAISKRKVYGDREESEKITQEAERKRRKLDQFYNDRMTRQVSLSKGLARLSPSASYLFAVTRLAGTGPILFDRFRDAHDRFQEAQQDWRSELFNSGKIQYGPGGPTVNEADWFDADSIPRFTMYSENTRQAIDAAMFDILLLVVFAVLFFMLSFVFFLRYDVT
ncbi:MAG: ABC transporter permease subunit [Gemmatimonadetes bacterium]|nr:ABC transporter permease subunit [Gemmatimonadota bacterium]MBT6144361.1 ABC transporter permease subunit [Gemmatimonadota bacterium]MBT7860557.1 ABC transporter permease subunit [Gemmatimonadota bacterium]